jgi:hypothetical protein
MLRTARVAPKEHVYYVLTRGKNRQDVFEDEDDFKNKEWGQTLKSDYILTNRVTGCI